MKYRLVLCENGIILAGSTDMPLLVKHFLISSTTDLSCIIHSSNLFTVSNSPAEERLVSE